MPWPQEMVLSGWKRLRIPWVPDPGFAHVWLARAQRSQGSPMPSVRLGVGLLAGLAAGGAVVLLSYCVYLDWRRHRDPAFRRRLQDSECQRGRREGGRPSPGWFPSRCPGHPCPCYLAFPASSCLCLQREELDSPRPRRPPGR